MTEGKLTIKTYEKDHGGIYCFKCGKVIGKGHKWAEVRGGLKCGWQGCPECAPEEVPK